MSDQPLNDAWGQGADGKWYPPEQLWGRAATPWPASPPSTPPRPPRWPWIALAVGGLASFVALAVLGAAAGRDTVDAADSAAAPPSTAELARPSTTSPTTTSTTSTTTTTTSTTAAPTTVAPPPTPPAPPPPPVPPATVAPPPPPVVAPPPVDVGVHYENCAAARAAGAAPVHRGQPGYARHLDRDGDGVGCE